MSGNYEVYNQVPKHLGGEGTIIKAWTKGVPFADNALEQAKNTAKLPFIHKHIAIMPDVHLGKGATIGSVVPTVGAIIPAAVGVDIGCGMMAVRTSLTASDLPDNLKSIRDAIECSVPHGRTDNGGDNDVGGWSKYPPESVDLAWTFDLLPKFKAVIEKHPKIAKSNNLKHLGTLGTGNHFIEMCLDTNDSVWLMLHSGSRGVGGRIGSYFIELAKQDMKKWFINVPDKDLAYLPEGTDHFDDYVQAVGWAQRFAHMNRQLMMGNLLREIRLLNILPEFSSDVEAINCHHNYVQKEHHFGKNVWVTRKGAVRARKGDLGIIPGSMGAKSYIVRGLGNPDSFNSCSHGAGRVMSRTEAKKTFTVEDHIKATAGVECKKDESVLDESPGCYKDIDSVMAAQTDLVEIVYTLKQIICVKG